MSEVRPALPLLADILSARAAKGPVPDMTPQALRGWLEIEVGALTRQTDPGMVRGHLVATAAMLTAWAEQLDRETGTPS